MDYFENWIYNNESKSMEEKLIKHYKDADDIFRNRCADGGATKFEKILKDIESNWEKYQETEYTRKLAHLTKANVLLRRGHFRNERFLSSKKDFQEALVLLEREFDPEWEMLPGNNGITQRDMLNLMIQMNLGKYFRNVGKNGRRSDLERALDEFKCIRNKIKERCAGKDKWSQWETHMWLEATTNIGRVNKSLYYLQGAKTCFWEIIKMLVPLYSDKSEVIIRNFEECREFSAWWKAESLKMDRESDEKELEQWSWKLYKNMSGSMELFGKYLIEALVQLGIVYRKERDYCIAEKLFNLVLDELDKNNVDAKNNLAVCWRKQKSYMERTQEKGNEQGENEAGEKNYKIVFEKLKKTGNRFAALHYYKCILEEKDKNNRENAIQELEGYRKANPEDLEVRLLLARFYQKNEDKESLKKSQALFSEIYENTPYIRKGTIGLKAYFNMTRELLRNKQFHQAKLQLEKIITECGETKDATPYVEESNLRMQKEADLLAEIDLAWCYQQLGDYAKAAKINEEILKRYKNDSIAHRLGDHNQKKIRNNLGECYLRLTGNEKIDEAICQFEQMLKMEPGNVKSKYYLAYAYMKRGSMEESVNEEDLQKACQLFEEAVCIEPDNVYACSGWIKVMVKLLELKDWKDQGLITKIEKRLKYPSGVYSMRSCANFSLFLQKMEETKVMGIERLEQLYRSLARIRLETEKENYEMLQSLLNNEVFKRMKALERGKILACIFPLYESVMQLKERCRYNIYGETTYPVHYTKLSTLKKLLQSEKDVNPRMRLWNMAYMNDSFEGRCFIELMEQVGENLKEQNGENLEKEKSSKKILSSYYPHMSGQQQAEELVLPVNDSTYVASFSNNKDAIHMWVSYAEDSQGCAITFAEGFFDACYPYDNLTEVTGFSNENYSLYGIKYLKRSKGQEDGDNKSFDLSVEGMPEIVEDMQEIWRQLRLLESLLDASKIHKTEEDTIRTYVTGFLNEIRFLFKDWEYHYEEEVRMIRCSYTAETDSENFKIPRLFIEVNRDIQIKEVQLGSKVSPSDANEIIPWLSQTGKVERVTTSKRHYK